jgi:hypothetical protein
MQFSSLLPYSTNYIPVFVFEVLFVCTSVCWSFEDDLLPRQSGEPGPLIGNKGAVDVNEFL